MFSAVHMHLAINHSPLYSDAFAFFVLLVGIVRRNRTLVTTALVVTIIAAVAGIATNTTGDGAERFFRKAQPPVAGVDLDAIHEHEDAAGWFVAPACVTAAIAAFALWWGSRRERPRWLEVVILIAVAFCLSIVIRVALLGGRIHHQEVRAVVSG